MLPRGLVPLWCVCSWALGGMVVEPSISSEGCGSALPGDMVPGGSVVRHMQVTDPESRLSVASRLYKISIPGSYNPFVPTPVLIYFHGQSGDETEADGFIPVGNQYGFITITPKGMTDGVKKYGECTGTGTAWNVGSAGRLDVCSPDTDPAIHTSCLLTAKVSNCNWATCYDDVHFVGELLATAKRELCIDTSRVYGTGGSNGAMLVYFAVTQLIPGTFRAIVPWYGLLLNNMFALPSVPMPVLHMHGLKDDTIPAHGSFAGGYYYTPLDFTFGAWAEQSGCNVMLGVTNFTTPWDGQDNFYCEQWHECVVAPVVRCIFPNEGHGFWPAFAEEITWWFMNTAWASRRQNASTLSPALQPPVSV